MNDMVNSVCTLEAVKKDNEYVLTLNVQLYWIGGCGLESQPCSLRTLETIKAFTSRFFAASTVARQDLQQPLTWSPRDFYDSVHVPDRDSSTPKILENALLACELYPFQRRAVAWLLRREGVEYDENGEVIPCASSTREEATSYVLSRDALGRECSHSSLLCDFQRGRGNIVSDMKGGILAEEMGLGKSVELLALIRLHKRTTTSIEAERGSATTNKLIKSGATLIITPPSILAQWQSEIKKYAPDLKVTVYTGMNTYRRPEARKVLKELDIVLTTYTALRQEIHYASEEPHRTLRYEKVHIPERSPLVEIEWWRVCLDEAQMVESGVSNAAKVARLIPRCNAWAVSGTPLRKNVNDLYGLLLFLNYRPFCMDKVWKAMLSGSHDAVFKDLFGRIAIRHTKARIRKELRLPPQKRIIITTPFTTVEEQNYSQLFQRMCDECGLDTDGAPIHDDWSPDRYVEIMRNWLARLRQTCLHPEIGIVNRRALGHQDAPIRTVDEVLEIMIDQNETALRAEERVLLTSMVTRGHVHSFSKQTEDAYDLYCDALEKSKHIVEECREQLTLELAKVAAASHERLDDDGGAAPLVKDEDEDSEEKSTRLPVLRQRLRSALEMQHMCAFFSATACFQIKSNPELTVEDSDEFKELYRKEAELYEQAKHLRQELLIDASAKATELMRRVAELKRAKFVNLPVFERFENVRGIESRKIVEDIEELRRLLNGQTKQIEDWRRKLVDLLLLRLVDQDEDSEVTGEEYELSTRSQDTQYVYIDALRASAADRTHILNGYYSHLIDVEQNGAHKTATQGDGHDPELFLSLFDLRRKFKLRADSTLSLRGVIAQLRALITSVRWQEGERGSNRAAVEVTILERELENLQNVATTQSKALAGLEKELDLFRSTMNQRLEFYRQLQHVSDMVAPYQEEMNEGVDEEKLRIELEKRKVHVEKLSALKTKRRFLLHLQMDSTTHHKQERLCVICQSGFEIGVLTVCGHEYCKDCINLWWSEHHTCPICKMKLKTTDFHNITYKPQELRAQEEHPSNQREELVDDIMPSKPSIYSSISAAELAAIQSIDLPVSYGTKIDTLARHLRWLRKADPGAKSIIFSQYRDFFEVLSSAFRRFGIRHISIGDRESINRFLTEPGMECFLLHAKAESSGLNLTVATHVFLCEPLINPSLELQAIARVHRIGQYKPTTVWMYLISDTVEEAIYDLSVSRRMAHMQRTIKASSTETSPITDFNPAGTDRSDQDTEGAYDTANSLELQTAALSALLAKGPGGGEVVSREDLWNCLFGKRARTEDAALSREVEEELGRTLRRTAAEARMAEEDDAW